MPEPVSGARMLAIHRPAAEWHGQATGCASLGPLFSRIEMTLAQIRRFALSLPGVTEKPHFDRTSFRVNGKIFVTARPSDSYIHVFVPEQNREPALAMHPEHFSKLLWGGKVVGLRVELSKVPIDVAKDIVTSAWESRAPKSLLSSRESSKS
jgi:hypothetical protein